MDSQESTLTKLSLRVLAYNETPGSLYDSPCPCGCGGRIGVETSRRRKQRDGRGWVIRFLKCKKCGFKPPDGQNKWVVAERD